jgi:hypothetical protein
LLPIVVVLVVVSADTAADVAAAVCTSSVVNGVAATIRANMSIVIIAIVFVDFLTVISLSSLLYAYYDLTGPFLCPFVHCNKRSHRHDLDTRLKIYETFLRESAARVVSKSRLRCQLEF